MFYLLISSLFFRLQNLFPNYRYTLLDIGLIIDSLMGGAFKSMYSQKEFRQKYVALRRIVSAFNNSITQNPIGKFIF